jgi:hypothetical protein
MSAQGDYTSATNEQTFVNLEAESEWRFELESDENIAVRVSRLIHLETRDEGPRGLPGRCIDLGRAMAQVRTILSSRRAFRLT